MVRHASGEGPVRLRTSDPICIFPVATLLLCFWGGDFGAAFQEPAPDKHLVQVQKRAEQGYAKEQIELAAAYLTGRGVRQDMAMAAHWYEKAAEGGDPMAQNQIGYCYRVGIGVRVDLERAVHWYQLSAAAGLPLAKVNLGVAYFTGHGVGEDPAQARELFRQATNLGLGLGAAYLGVMDYAGVGGPVNKASAERWFELGTKLHDPVAAYNLAYLYSKSEDHPHDLRKAAELLRQSVEKGYVRGDHALGILLVNHPELATSQQEAPVLLEEASDAGYWKASATLGILSRDGRQVAKDPSRAWYYFQLAALQGGQEAQKAMAADTQSLTRMLPDEERARVSAEAGAWFDQHRTAFSYVTRKGNVDRDFPMLAAGDSLRTGMN